MFCQLWHGGRVSHPDLQNGKLPLSASAIHFEGKVFTTQGEQTVVTPRNSHFLQS
jgi:N-ethylmaleimide reductase